MPAYNERVRFPEIERPTFVAPLLRVFIMATVITLVIIGGVLPFKGTFVRDLLVGRETIESDRVFFQGLTIFMWAMSASTVLVKKRQQRLEHRALRDQLIPADIEIGEDRSLLRAFEQLTKRPDFAHSIVVSRMARALAAWINTRDFDRTLRVVRDESELDMHLSDASFRANRLYIWAMPLLGFVGTVYGVSYGIGGFAEFLKGQVTADQIKEQVGLITEGLAVAFYTTLVGLFTAGAAAFPSLGAESREEELLGELDEMIDEQLMSRLPTVRQNEFPVEHFQAIREGVESLNIHMTENINALTRSIAEGLGKLPSPQVYEKVFAQAITSAAGLIHEKYHQFATQYERQVAALGDQLSGRMDRVAANFAQAGDAQAAAQRQAAEQLQHAMKELGGVADATRQETAEASKRISGSLDRVTETGAQIDQLLRATRAFETALGRMATAEDFQKAMQSLRAHLTATDAMVERLSRPRRVVFEEK